MSNNIIYSFGFVCIASLALIIILITIIQSSVEVFDDKHQDGITSPLISLSQDSRNLQFENMFDSVSSPVNKKKRGIRGGKQRKVSPSQLSQSSSALNRLKLSAEGR